MVANLSKLLTHSLAQKPWPYAHLHSCCLLCVASRMIHLRLITFRVKSLFIPRKNNNNKRNKSACRERSAPGLDIHSHFCWSLGRPISCGVTSSSSDLLALVFLFVFVVCVCLCVYRFAEIRINNTKCALVIYICYTHSSIFCTMQRQTDVHA